MAPINTTKSLITWSNRGFYRQYRIFYGVNAARRYRSFMDYPVPHRSAPLLYPPPSPPPRHRHRQPVPGAEGDRRPEIDAGLGRQLEMEFAGDCRKEKSRLHDGEG